MLGKMKINNLSNHDIPKRVEALLESLANWCNEQDVTEVELLEALLNMSATLVIKGERSPMEFIRNMNDIGWKVYDVVVKRLEEENNKPEE
jgi:hypothetical protein